MDVMDDTGENMSDYSRQDRIEEEKIDLIRIINDMVKGVKRFWPLFLVAVVLFSGFYYIRAYRSYQPVYTSNATFTVMRDDSSLYNNTYVNEQAATQIVKTFPYILNSGLLQKRVAADLGVESVPGVITTEILGSTNMITIVVTSYKEEYAQKILESVIEHYPIVAEPVIGEVKMNLLDITEVPENTAYMPSVKGSILRGGMAAVVVSFVFLLVYAFTRDTIHEEEDVKKRLNIDCICAIPQIVFKKRGTDFKKDISIYNKKIAQSFLESIRVLRARIEKDAVKNQVKVFLVTSAAPGEGKSTIAANVAMALAMGGADVALVDCDLRSPSVREILGLETEGNGLCDILTGNIAVEDVMIRDKVHKINVLPGGKPYNNAAELLDSSEMKETIEYLKNTNDYVILDTAPVGMLTDTAVLAQAAEAALFVVKQDYVNCSNILEGIDQLAESKVYISGCILNGAQAGIGGYGYRYQRYYNRYGNYFADHRYQVEELERNG